MSASLQKLFKQKDKQLFTHGGPGSGYHDHRGRPGFVGGSSKGGSASGEGTAQDGLDRLFNPQPVDHKKRVEEVVKKLGFPLDRVVSTEDEGYLFNVGDQQFRAAGDYNPKTGQVNIYNIDEQSDMTMEGILSHEIMHDKWRTFRTEYQRQFIEVNRSIQGDDRSEWLINMDGSLRNPGDREKFWAYDLNEKFLTGDFRNTLGKLDGVTPYSDAYWSKALDTGSGYDFELAVNETLAEIARLESNLSGTGVGVDEMQSVDPLWKSLYKKVKRGGVKQNRKLFTQTFEGHEGRPGMVGGSLPKSGSSGKASVAGSSVDRDDDDSQSVLLKEAKALEGDKSALQSLKSAVTDWGNPCLVYRDEDGSLVGAMSYYVEDDKLVINNLGSIKKGTGRLAIKDAVSIAQDLDLDYVRAAARMDARAFWDHAGFELKEGSANVFLKSVKQNLFHFGGEGSGNFGHEGRLGLVGGSGKGEGFREVSMASAEKKIATESTEHVLLYDRNGKLIAYNDTQAQFGNEAVFSRVQEKGAVGGVVTHNHPHNQSFSPEDIAYAGKLRLSEIRAVTPKGVTYSMKPMKGNRWPNPGKIELAGAHLERIWDWGRFWEDSSEYLELTYTVSGG